MVIHRRRGENLLIRFGRMDGESRFDILSAQAPAITGIGQLILDAAQGSSAGGYAFTFMERLQSRAGPSS